MNHQGMDSKWLIYGLQAVSMAHELKPFGPYTHFRADINGTLILSPHRFYHKWLHLVFAVTRSVLV
jgi:hypothetical protein